MSIAVQLYIIAGLEALVPVILSAAITSPRAHEKCARGDFVEPLNL